MIAAITVPGDLSVEAKVRQGAHGLDLLCNVLELEPARDRGPDARPRQAGLAFEPQYWLSLWREDLYIPPVRHLPLWRVRRLDREYALLDVLFVLLFNFALADQGRLARERSRQVRQADLLDGDLQHWVPIRGGPFRDLLEFHHRLGFLDRPLSPLCQAVRLSIRNVRGLRGARRPLRPRRLRVRDVLTGLSHLQGRPVMPRSRFRQLPLQVPGALDHLHRCALLDCAIDNFLRVREHTVHAIVLLLPLDRRRRRLGGIALRIVSRRLRPRQNVSELQ